MNYLIDTLAVLAIACIGTLAGFFCGRLSKYCWIAAYIFALALIFAVNVPMGTFGVKLSEGLRFLTADRREFIILSFAAPLMFAALVPRLKDKAAKVLLSLFIGASVLVFTIVPFFVPLLIRNLLADIQTRFSGAVCLQSTDFTSGPAAAVTALGQIGIIAEEGIIAVDSYSTPFWGTDEDLLAHALNNRYSKQGALCRQRSFKSVEELGRYCPTIAVVRLSAFIDSFVTIIEVRGDFLLIGDGLEGLVRMSVSDFKKIWRFRGIVVSKAGQIIIA